ncbi:LPS-assembly protein LptD [Cypionkella aquatica]|uniref:LPS-assembly protein LptD n=1 Tax=Cypionkella aquatica TaxID=1756042 RepID=A0AA37U0Q1_9RHOB|nr:LPS assembly protein LptD [Cypionkella aquatica]GLS87612.1 LPS-assembly protein LptD [Cypionkella aquatica]
MFRLLSLLVALGFALPALAQDKATLVADALQIKDNSTLIASGHVEIFYQGQKLTAQSVTYDQAADRLLIAGPIVLTDGKGAVILANQAEMDADLTQGVLTSARLVLQQQLQMAAAEIRRVDGRYTSLQRVVASSCKVCAGSSVPLWEIRARRVVHDQAEQQLYFDHAQFRLGRLPVMYIPRLRIPDPSLKRASGFLLPVLKNNSNFGTGLLLPYFIKMGDSRDLTVTPFFTTDGSRTVNLRYREAFTTGFLEVSGGVSRDQLMPGETRGYVLGTGAFVLPRGFKLDLRVEAVSDPAYILDYDYPTADRLESRVEVSRTRRNEYISGRLIAFHSIRDGEDNATLPSRIGDLTYHRRFTLGSLGGEGGFEFQLHGHERTSNDALNDVNMDGIADGRDMQRLSLRADWRKNILLDNGMEAAVLGEAAADFYLIGQDAEYDGSKTRLHGALGAELRWPWVKSQANGVSQVIEPVVQLVLASRSGTSIPNEDSALVEFDETNLFDLSRFPGADAVENGTRANLGVSYLRLDPNGWTLGVTVGRVLRTEDLGQFSTASGLSGVSSDWMAAWQLEMAGLNLTNRLVFDDQFNMTKAEVQLAYTGDRFNVVTGYVHTEADRFEDSATLISDPISELTLATGVKLTDNWSGRVASRYDFEAERAAKAGLGLTYRNECLLVDLSLSRRFTSSTSVKPTTDFGLSVELLGFGGSSAPGPARQCRR